MSVEIFLLSSAEQVCGRDIHQKILSLLHEIVGVFGKLASITARRDRPRTIGSKNGSSLASMSTANKCHAYYYHRSTGLV